MLNIVTKSKTPSTTTYSGKLIFIIPKKVSLPKFISPLRKPLRHTLLSRAYIHHPHTIPYFNNFKPPVVTILKPNFAG